MLCGLLASEDYPAVIPNPNLGSLSVITSLN
jgi:hypothetical protein